MADSTQLDGRHALVTGASSGIGRATADVLAREGADVAIAARSEEDLEALADEIESAHDATVLPVPTDVSEEDEVEAMVDAAVDEFGGLDVVVNNAGVGGIDADIAEVPTDRYRQLHSVNVDGMFYTTRAVVPHLRKTDGNLVFVASFAGQYPRPSSPLYAATKWWTRGFALSLAGDVGEDDVGVTIINPTEVRTDLGSEQGDPLKERFEEGEVTEPIDIAEAIAFAAQQDPPNTVNELDLYRRDKFSHF